MQTIRTVTVINPLSHPGGKTDESKTTVTTSTISHMTALCNIITKRL